MICTFCGSPLKGLTDAKLVNVDTFTRSGRLRRDLREPACIDTDACNARLALRERARDADFGPDGDATTPGFFRRAGE